MFSQKQQSAIISHTIENRLKKETHDRLKISLTLLFKNDYAHLTGKMGKSRISMEVNIMNNESHAYMYCDSLDNINGFDENENNGIITFTNNEWLFVPGLQHIDKLILAVKKDSILAGYAIDDSTGKYVACSLKEDHSDSSLLFKKTKFQYTGKFREFPVELYGNILFADTITQQGIMLNKYLLKKYDIVGLNYNEVIKTMSFTDMHPLQTVDSFKTYLTKKFIKAYKKIIDKQFLEEAHESGHTDIYANGIASEILWNDKTHLVFQLTASYADGNSYPYYESTIFEFDKLNNKEIVLKRKGQDADTVKLKQIIERLSNTKRFDDDENNFNDNMFLYSPRVAFITRKGIVLVKFGGNHGIHPFYKFYPKKLLEPLELKY